MNFIDKAIETFAPAYALKREVARSRLSRFRDARHDLENQGERSVEAVIGGRRRYDFLTTSKSADSAIKDDVEALRNQVRQMEYNNGFVSGPIRRNVNNVVGKGIRFQARVRPDDRFGTFPKITEEDAEAFNFFMEKHIRAWMRQADMRLQLTFSELQRMAEAALMRDGEVLVIGRDSDRKGRPIPYCLEIREADRLTTPMEEINNPRIRNGIEYDDEGVPKTYYVLKVHPGDSFQAARQRNAFEEIPAFHANGTRKMLHLYNPLRPEQSRGLSEFAAAIKFFQDLDRYWEAELYAALEDACLTGIVKTTNPYTYQQNATEASGSEKYDRIHEFAPGKWHYLKPGQEVEIHGPKRPNTALGEHTNQLLRGPSNALDMPPEVLSQNWQGMNYSNARTVLLQFYLTCRIRQQYLIDHLCIPVYENAGRAFIARGRVKAPGFDRRMEDWLAHAWIPPGWQWVDPVKEAKGKEVSVDNFFETLTDIHAGQGADFEENLEVRARELRRIRETEEKFGVSFGAAKAAKGPATVGKEDLEDGDEETGAAAAAKTAGLTAVK